MNFRRALLLAAVVGLSPATLHADSPDAVVTFNEIHYHPPLTQDAEWIELHNQMAVNIDLSGWSIADGINYTFPEGTIIAGGGFRVIAKAPGHPLLAGVPGVLGPYAGNLSNGGETLDLVSRSGRLMDRLAYGDDGDWPLAADGAGASLAKRRPGTAAEPAANWRASLESGGTPGTVNFLHPDQPVVHPLVGTGGIWRYRDEVASPPPTWESGSFDDSGWAQGAAPFGSAPSEPVLAVTAGLTARYRASDIPGATDGDTFSPWPDLATGDGVSQDAVAGGDPRFVSDATPAGEAAVSFDGNDEFRTSLSPGIDGNSGFAYFIVCKANASPQSGGVTDGSGAYLFDRDAAVDNPLVSLKAVNGRYGFQKRHDNGSGLGGLVSSTAISTSDFQIVALRRNPAAGRFEVWVDGVMEATVADSGAALTPQPLVIGRHATEATGGFDGEIAELLVYRDALDDDDFQSVGAYLEARHGLSTAFPDTVVATGIAPGVTTTYLRQSFNFTGDPSRATLQLDHTLADGAVFYLNGQEIARTNLPEGEISHTTEALSDVGQAVPTGFQAVSASALANGTNVLAASLHTAGPDASCYFTAQLRAVESPPDPDLAAPLRIHEIAAAGSGSFFIEIINTSPATLSTGGHVLELTGSESAVMPLPAVELAPGGIVHFTAGQLGFLPLAGDKVILRGPSGAPDDVRAVDLVPRGLSDDWPGRWLFPSTPTPGAANAFALQQDIVIHELCYHPPSVTAASDDKQWLELHNRGDGPVDLGGWSFGAGITFAFPSGTVINPGGYLVVAKSPGNFPVPPGIAVTGPWSGNLANGGETVLLLDGAGNPADEVPYVDGGRWPGAADGDGSSLELRDPRADNSLPGSWAASDESDRRAWQSYSYRSTASGSTGPDGQWRDFVFGMLDSGEILIDDISVIENPDTTAVSMIANGDFESGNDGWHFLGNHRDASLVPDPDSPGNTVLHLRATGATEHMHNHVETALANGESVVNGREYEISFRARWLEGSNRLNTRLYFNRTPRTTELLRSDTPGTPGAPNSTALPNLGPGLTGFRHAPAVPAPGEPVTVSVGAEDPDGLGDLTLHYAVDGAPFTTVPMTPGADGITFSGAIPGQAAASVVRFHVEAADAAGMPAISFHPAAGPDSHALYQVDDGLAATNGLHNIRIIMDPAGKELLYRTNNLMSNGRIGCTMIYGEREVYYDIGVRLKSSQRGRPEAARVGFNLGFHKDQLFRGIHRTVAIDRSEGQITGCQEILYDHMMYASGGVPAEFNDLCKVIAPDPAHSSQAILQLARFGDVFLESQFESGDEGTVHEYELIYYPTTTDGDGFKLPQPDNVVGTDITDLGDDKENYRWNFLLKNNEDADDYSGVMAMAKQFGKSGGEFEAGLGQVIDIDQWLRAIAYSCASGAGDSFFDNANHNGQFYTRPDGRVLYFPHDMDFSFNATRGIYQNSELQKLVADPARRRAYLGHLHEICTTVFNQSYMSAWTGHYGSLLPGENFGAHLAYIDTRSNYILGAITDELPPLPFEITTNGGAGFSTGTSPVTLAGQGWIDVRAIRLAGSAIPLDVTWTSQSGWEIAVPLAAGPNEIVLEALDAAGGVVGSDGITVTNTGGIQPPDPDTLVISEIYYNPPGSDETTEYVELMNITADLTLDLSNVAFTEGISVIFPGGTLLAPGARILAVKDVGAFEAAFGAGRPVVASFPNRLANSGEQVELRRADGTVLHSFVFSDQPPWPVEADGDGYSLVLVDPWSAPDHGDPLSWRASLTADGGTPGTTDTEPYLAWKAAHGDHADGEDLDGDGFTTREEYFLGGDPMVADFDLAPTFLVEPGGSLVMSVTRRVTAETALVTPQVSDNLSDWEADTGAALLENVRLAGEPARDRLTFRLTPPPGAPRFFARFAFGN